MKNLKRIFSLALAGTMLAGMLTVGASAAEFTDADKIVNANAVDTMVALNIINGKDDGSFDPEAVVTRAEMVKMITVALNGGKDPVLGTKTNPTYTDIGGHWAEKYIEYCSNLGIIGGRGDGTFDPNGTVTGTEAAKMVLVAMGYDSTVYKFTGADWATNVNIQANDATPYKLYEDIESIDPSTGLTRDNAAQLIFNGVQDDMMGKSASLTITNGEISYSYSKQAGKSILTEKYDAKVFIGEMKGNYDTNNDEADEGEIIVAGKLDSEPDKDKDGDPTTRTVAFPSEFGIENIGEQVKVIFKDGKNGTDGDPDAKDTIYGVFNTGKTTVYTATKADITGATENDDKEFTKLKINGTNRNVSEDGIKVYKNFITKSAATTITTKAAATTRWVDVESIDTVKFVCDANGKIVAAYEVEYKPSKITAVTSSKITVSGAGALKPEDHNIYEDAKKDDVVVYTHYYNATAGKGLYNVTKAESIEGQITGYKTDDNDNFSKIYIDDKEYTINNHALDSTVVDTSITDPKNDIESTVRLYLVNGLAVAAELIEETGGNYAVVTDTAIGEVIDLGSKLSGWKVTVMTTDGEEETYTVHKDSFKAIAGDDDDDDKKAALKDGLTHGALIEYTISNGQLKVKEIFGAPNSGYTAPAADQQGNTLQLWDEDTKKFTTKTDGTAKVAASNAILFVRKLDKNGAETDSYSVHTLRDLGDFSAVASTTKVAFDTNSSGLVTAACVTLKSIPGGQSADTRYGIVVETKGTHVVGKNTYTQYVIAVGVGETLVANIDKDSDVISVGDVVIFDETSNNVYDENSFQKLEVAANGTVTGGNGTWTVGAVKSYNNGTLSYGTATETAGTNIYKISGDTKTETVKADAVIAYVDLDSKEPAYGEETGIKEFNVNSGKENILFHINDKGVVDIVFVETGDNGFGATAKFPK